MNKKGQGLPLNVIIVAIIVLVVLVVLIAIFTGRLAIFQSGLDRQANVEGIKVRAGLSNDCVPSDAGVQGVLAEADQNGNSKIDDNEAVLRERGLQQLVAECDSQGSSSEAVCRASGRCQWSG